MPSDEDPYDLDQLVRVQETGGESGRISRGSTQDPAREGLSMVRSMARRKSMSLWKEIGRAPL